MILPGPVSSVVGAVEVPGSKSLTNRALIAAAVADGGVIHHPLICDDTRLLAEALTACGWPVDWRDTIEVGRRVPVDDRAVAWLGDSGTGARLMVGLLAATQGRFVVDGSPRLRQRPMGALVDALRSLGADVDGPGDGLPLTINGRKLSGGAVEIRPEVSSQFVSALLLAAPLMERGLDLKVDGSLPSRPYVDLTVDILHELGVGVEHDEATQTWGVAPAIPRTGDLRIEGDWSAAAFFVAAAAVAGGRVQVSPVSLDSHQGDRVVCDIVGDGGVAVSSSESGVVVYGPAIKPLDARLEHAPDLFPALSVVAASGPPGSVLRGLDHLKHKESDRLTVMVRNLCSLGAEIEVTDSTFRVTRPMDERPDQCRSVIAAADHRIAMAMAIAALHAGPLDLDDPECVAKSYPGFWDAWRALLSVHG